MEIIIILFLILLNGVFSMSEMALVSVKKTRLEMDAKKGSSRAKAALALVEHPNNFLSTVQIGITLIGILTGIFSGDKIATDLRLSVETIPELAPYASTYAYFDRHYFSHFSFWRIITQKAWVELPKCNCQNHGCTHELYLQNNRSFCLAIDQNNRWCAESAQH